MRAATTQTCRLGMSLALASIGMLFVALTSAYVVRQGLGGDWRRISMPPVLWLNTAALLASSFTMEAARRARGSGRDVWRRWLAATFALGLAFVFGQLAAWRSLSAQGVYLSTNPHSSFFYLLTGLHGCHVLGGVLALGWVNVGTAARQERWVETTALYWHFMGGLWLYLLVLLFR